MRHLRWALPGIFALAIAGSASAQTAGNFSSGLTGVSPSAIKFKTIDTSTALQGATGAVNAGTSNSSFSLSGFFRKLVGPSPKQVIGVSNIPAAQYRAAFAPLPPVIGTVPTTR